MRDITAQFDSTEALDMVSKCVCWIHSSEETSIDTPSWSQSGVEPTSARPPYVGPSLNIDWVDTVSNSSDPTDVDFGGVFGGVYGG